MRMWGCVPLFAIPFSVMLAGRARPRGPAYCFTPPFKGNDQTCPNLNTLIYYIEAQARRCPQPRRSDHCASYGKVCENSSPWVVGVFRAP